ncbi:alpha-hydroxy acid oxidase [Croceicoccus ponticola]|nr:alpha-hydroxy acid oxidase [Croceicoccus ponticola]
MQWHDAEGVMAVARQSLHEAVWRYLQTGMAESETGAMNERAWSELRLIPRVPFGSERALPAIGCRLSGCDVAGPLIVAPTGRATRFHPDGELAVLRAGRSRNLLVALPSSVAHALEPLHAACPDAKWWQQLYCSDDRAYLRDICQTAKALGCRAMVLTVDLREPADTSHMPTAPIASWEAGIEKRAIPVRLRADFKDIEWFTEAAGLPVIVKGVMHPEDVRHCAEIGVKGVVVSNHGGMLRDAAATAQVLGACVGEAGGRLEVFVDGAIRNGRTLLKAQALGASGVLVGRIFSASLAAAGEDGVARSMDMFLGELRHSLLDVGKNGLDELGTDCLFQSMVNGGFLA